METLKAPPRTRLYRQFLGLLNILRLPWHLPGLRKPGKGDGQCVLVLPGYGAGDWSTAVLRRILRSLAYDARGWGLGKNTGDTPALFPAVLDLVESSHRQCGKPITLIGWSMGGYLAREAARDIPHCVQQVITLGSPVVGGPKYTWSGSDYTANGFDLDDIEAEVEARYAVRLRTPVTAIYSKADGIVAWRACIDNRSECVDHVEVNTTHFGLGFSPEVYRIITQRLAAPLLCKDLHI